MRRLVVILAFCVFSSTSVTTAADIFSLYSDVCWHQEAGDLLGTRIGIMKLPDDSYIFLQVAEGDWSKPSVGKAEAENLRRGKLAFDFWDGIKQIKFHGTVTPKAIVGQFDGWVGPKGGPLAVHLNRVSFSTKRVPNC